MFNSRRLTPAWWSLRLSAPIDLASPSGVDAMALSNPDSRARRGQRTRTSRSRRRSSAGAGPFEGMSAAEVRAATRMSSSRMAGSNASALGISRFTSAGTRAPAATPQQAGALLPVARGAAGPIIAAIRALLARGLIAQARQLYNNLPQVIKSAIPPSIVAAIFETVVPDIRFGNGNGTGPGTITGGSASDVLKMIGGVVTKVWTPFEGAPTFHRIDFPGTNRRTKIAVVRNDGTIKTYTPPRHIVVSRDPGIRTLTRAAKKLDTLTKRLVKAPTQTKNAKARVK